MSLSFKDSESSSSSDHLSAQMVTDTGESTITPEIEPPSVQYTTSSSALNDINDKDLMEIVDNTNLNKLDTEPQPKSVKINTNKSTIGKSQPKPAKASNELRDLIAGGAKIGEGIPTQPYGNGNLAQGSGDDMDGRIKMYGAKTGDIQISLIWNTIDDIDLHVNYSNNIANETIFWRYRAGRSGGMLDIDMNGSGPQSNRPIENIFWPYNTAPQGQYTVGVHFFRSWSQNRVVPAVIRIKTPKGTTTHNIIVRLGDPVLVVTTFSN